MNHRGSRGPESSEGNCSSKYTKSVGILGNVSICGLPLSASSFLCKVLIFFPPAVILLKAAPWKVTARTRKHTALLCNYLPYLNPQLSLNIIVSPALPGKENIPNICFVFRFTPFNGGARVLVEKFNFSDYFSGICFLRSTLSTLCKQDSIRPEPEQTPADVRRRRIREPLRRSHLCAPAICAQLFRQAPELVTERQL